MRIKLKLMSVYTLSQYQALTAAIALGATKVQYADKTVEYRSLSDMIRLKEAMESDLGISKNIVRRKFIEQGRGYE